VVQYYHPLLSLFGTLLCVAAMFLMDWVTALLTYLITGVLYFYIYYRKPGRSYLQSCGSGSGSISQRYGTDPDPSIIKQK
jgi:hypothetical protein